MTGVSWGHTSSGELAERAEVILKTSFAVAPLFHLRGVTVNNSLRSDMFYLVTRH